jgi:hypothetical protein
VLLEDLGSSNNGIEVKVGPLGDVEQRVLTIGKVEHPQHRELGVGDIGPPERSVQSAGTEPGFAVRL